MQRMPSDGAISPALLSEIKNLRSTITLLAQRLYGSSTSTLTTLVSVRRMGKAAALSVTRLWEAPYSVSQATRLALSMRQRDRLLRVQPVAHSRALRMTMNWTMASQLRPHRSRAPIRLGLMDTVA